MSIDYGTLQCFRKVTSASGYVTTYEIPLKRMIGTGLLVINIGCFEAYEEAMIRNKEPLPKGLYGLRPKGCWFHGILKDRLTRAEEAKYDLDYPNVDGYWEGWEWYKVRQRQKDPSISFADDHVFPRSHESAFRGHCQMSDVQTAQDLREPLCHAVLHRLQHEQLLRARVYELRLLASSKAVKHRAILA